MKLIILVEIFSPAMKCVSINTGFLNIPLADMFVTGPGFNTGTRLPKTDSMECSIRSLLIMAGTTAVLIDTGVGTLIGQEILDQYDYRSEGDWESLLEPYDLSPSDITDVILTHLHFDHCGGAVQLPPGSSNPEDVALTFPNATHWISRKNWDWAQNKLEQEPDSFFEYTFLPIQKSGKLILVDKESEIIAGITVRIFHGHTRGLMIPIITSGNETVVFAGDLIPTAVHLHPEIGMSYDLDPELVREEKKGFLAEITSANFKLIFQHEPLSRGERREERGERRKERGERRKEILMLFLLSPLSFLISHFNKSLFLIILSTFSTGIRS
jgi:glyoxylase-like metal-dependent hydrolase (beta-lactamase superfamily II)